MSLKKNRLPKKRNAYPPVWCKGSGLVPNKKGFCLSCGRPQVLNKAGTVLYHRAPS